LAPLSHPDSGSWWEGRAALKREEGGGRDQVDHEDDDDAPRACHAPACSAGTAQDPNALMVDS